VLAKVLIERQRIEMVRCLLKVLLSHHQMRMTMSNRTQMSMEQNQMQVLLELLQLVVLLMMTLKN